MVLRPAQPVRGWRPNRRSPGRRRAAAACRCSAASVSCSCSRAACEDAAFALDHHLGDLVDAPADQRDPRSRMRRAPAPAPIRRRSASCRTRARPSAARCASRPPARTARGSAWEVQSSAIARLSVSLSAANSACPLSRRHTSASARMSSLELHLFLPCLCRGGGAAKRWEGPSVRPPSPSAPPSSIAQAPSSWPRAAPAPLRCHRGAATPSPGSRPWLRR